MSKYAAKGTQLLMGDGAVTEVFTKIAQLASIGPLSLTKNTVDTTDHDSADDTVEHLETTRDYGEIPFRGHWDPANATHDDTDGIWSKFAGDGPSNFKLSWPNASSITAPFSASVVGLEVGEATMDGKLEISGRLKVSGKITLA